MTLRVEDAQPMILAAVRATVPASGIAAAWRPALDKVWAFLWAKQVSNTGLNVFLYHHPARSGEAMDVDFGVQVLLRFEDESGVRCIATPAGKVAQTVHVGSYGRLGEAHAAVHRWGNENGRTIGGSSSWEIYGHWNSDPAKLETTVQYLLG